MYTDHYKSADDIIQHLDSVVANISDPFITSRYVGLVAIAAVTVYELAIKDIFVGFGDQTHTVLGNFTRMYFGRINGRIMIKDIRKEYLTRFGENYKKQFDTELNKAELEILRKQSVSIKHSYGNIITWRHGFVHGGQIPSTATYQEVTKSYKLGKEVIRCLAETMK